MKRKDWRFYFPVIQRAWRQMEVMVRTWVKWVTVWRKPPTSMYPTPFPQLSSFPNVGNPAMGYTLSWDPRDGTQKGVQPWFFVLKSVHRTRSLEPQKPSDTIHFSSVLPMLSFVPAEACILGTQMTHMRSPWSKFVLSAPTSSSSLKILTVLPLWRLEGEVTF